MKKLFFPLFLIVVFSMSLFGCKKDKDDENPNNTVQDVRTSEYSFTVSGDFEGMFDISVNNAVGVTGGVVGVYDSDVNEFSLSLTATGLPENGSWGLELYTAMPQLVPGSYELNDGTLGNSQFFFVDESGDVSFSVDSGTLNITTVELAPLFIPAGVSGHYINGTVALAMSNDDNQTATAQGQIVNGVIIAY